MKKKSTTQSAFFNLRVLMGLSVVLAGVVLALVGTGVFSTIASGETQKLGPIRPELLPPGFDCSKIHELGIDRQDNMHAGTIMIGCGLSEGGGEEGLRSPSKADQLAEKLLPKALAPAPSFIGTSDVDVILPDGTSPHVTQSESMSWCGPSNTCVVNYNDSRTAPSCYAGLSYSTDNGVTWHASEPLCSGHGTNFGDPIVVYNAHLGMWFAGDLATGCGGQGVGLWTSPNGITWTAGACPVNTTSGDRESMWVDNNPASPHYGRMYISFNDFAVNSGALEIVYSDNGTTWTGPVTLNGAFIRDVQTTGDLGGSGRVYVASMNEEGGSLGTRQNVVYRSTDGGATWASSTTGPVFNSVGRSNCAANAYFVCMFGTNDWRHMGWGEPTANGNFVSLDYAQKGSGSDLGDIYYVRSTDAGVTWGTPVKLNTDSGTAMQWQPSMSTTTAGAIFASWYDQREVNGGADLNCTAGNASQNCYRRWGRLSFDNGATWQPDDQVGRSLSPLPAQPDSGVQPNYQGDYDYHSSNGTNIIGGWTDGRVAIAGASQQDVFVNTVTGGFGVTSSVPACGSVISTLPVDFVINLSAAVNTTTVQASDFTVNGTPSNVAPTFSNGNATITFHFSSTPVVSGTNTMHIAAGAFTDTNGNAVADFTCAFCEAATPLQVTSTVPAVGGTFTPPAPGTYSYAVNFNQNIDPSSVSTSDLTLTGNVGGSVTNVTVSGSTATFTVHFQFGGSVTASIAAGSITANGCNANAAFSGNYTVSGCSPSWSAGPNLPTVLIRAVGVYFPADGNFYTMGGRTADTAGSDFQHVLKYSPGANTWTQMPSTLPDNTMNNMACGVMTVSGTPLIYCVGGSAATQTTATARVFSYNPATDTVTTLTAADNWPGDAAGTILPGGFAVSNNKLYILGGFNINVASTNQIYTFDPTAAVGAKWTLAPVTTPEGIMYAPTTAIGGIIYVGGASDYSGGTVIDTTNSFSFNPTTNTIGTIAPIPRATGETRALNINGLMYVIGGGRVAPNPSTEIDIYNPGSNSWSTGVPFTVARRNFPTDTNGTDHIWLGGGYDSSGVNPLNTMEIFQCVAAVNLTGAVSRVTHSGGCGTFDTTLPGIEDRSTGGNYTIVATFSGNETVTSASVTCHNPGTGTGTTGVVSGSGTPIITIPLTGVSNGQTLNVHINGTANADIQFTVLIGDTNGNGTVNAADIAQTKGRLGQTVTAANFRSDLNANCSINAADVAIIKQNSGSAAPLTCP